MFQNFILSESKNRLRFTTFFIAVILGAGVYFIASEFITKVEIEEYLFRVLIAFSFIETTVAIMVVVNTIHGTKILKDLESWFSVHFTKFWFCIQSIGFSVYIIFFVYDVHWFYSLYLEFRPYIAWWLSKFDLNLTTLTRKPMIFMS